MSTLGSFTLDLLPKDLSKYGKTVPSAELYDNFSHVNILLLQVPVSCHIVPHSMISIPLLYNTPSMVLMTLILEYVCPILLILFDTSLVSKYLKNCSISEISLPSLLFEKVTPGHLTIYKFLFILLNPE